MTNLVQSYFLSCRPVRVLVWAQSRLGGILLFRSALDRRWSAQVKKSQSGAAMLEVVAAVTVMGTASALALNHTGALDAIALKTHAQVTAAAIHSAARMQQAHWLVSQSSRGQSSMVFTKDGVPMGIDNLPEASKADCQALWQTLVSTPQAIEASHRYWTIDGVGDYCRFSYHHENLGIVRIDYHTVSGDVHYQL